MVSTLRYSCIKLIYILIDVFSVAFSIYLACLIRQGSIPFEATLQNLFFTPGIPFRFIFLFWILVTILVNNSYGLYQTKREIFEGQEIWQVLRSVFISSLLTIVAIYLAKAHGFPRSLVGWGFFFNFFFLAFWRLLKRFFVIYLVTQGYNNFHALIVGAGKVGQALAEEIHKRPGMGIKVIGFLDDFKINLDTQSYPKVLGKLSDFGKVAREEFINKVFITIHHDSQVFLQLLEQAKEMKIAVRVIPQGFDFMTGECRKSNIGFIPILEYSDAENMYTQAGKRLFDFILVLILTVLCLPLILALAFFIKLDSHGPVFYFSHRYGRKGRRFKMYKFRSMVNEADQLLAQLRDKNEVDGPIFKIKDDPRITRVGKFLRKYSLDELPQLFNVLKGEMSLVGPRPLPIDQIEKEDLRQLERLEVRPGITGLWQIRGRSDLSFSRLVKWDIWYINNWSFWLDLNILWQTIPIVLKGKGAY